MIFINYMIVISFGKKKGSFLVYCINFWSVFLFLTYTNISGPEPNDVDGDGERRDLVLTNSDTHQTEADNSVIDGLFLYFIILFCCIFLLM